jgi:hypothetical protein
MCEKGGRVRSRAGTKHPGDRQRRRSLVSGSTAFVGTHLREDAFVYFFDIGVKG